MRPPGIAECLITRRMHLSGEEARGAQANKLEGIGRVWGLFPSIASVGPQMGCRGHPCCLQQAELKLSWARLATSTPEPCWAGSPLKAGIGEWALLLLDDKAAEHTTTCRGHIRPWPSHAGRPSIAVSFRHLPYTALEPPHRCCDHQHCDHLHCDCHHQQHPRHPQHHHCRPPALSHPASPPISPPALNFPCNVPARTPPLTSHCPYYCSEPNPSGETRSFL